MREQQVAHSAVELFLDRLRQRGFTFKQIGLGHRAQCPGHQGEDLNLAIDEGDDGRPLLTCHSRGCTFDAILAGVGLTLADFRPPSANGKHPAEPEHRYTYYDEAGEPRYRKLRFPGKEFSFDRKLTGLRRLLYRIPDLLKLPPGQLVLINEGEKATDRCWRAGIAATNGPFGGQKSGIDKKWPAEFTTWLKEHRAGDTFAVVADNDETGEAFAAAVAQQLHRAGLDAVTLRLPDLPKKGDAYDWLDAGGTREQLPDLVKAAQQQPHTDKETPPGSVLPEIIVTNRPLREVAAEALQVLAAANEPPEFFVRSGAITRVRTDENRRPLIEPVSDAALRGKLTRSADFFAITKHGPRHTSPPMGVVADVLALGKWPFPALEAVVEVPVLRPDGTILGTPGYDLSTRLIFLPEPGLQVPVIPDRPTREDAQKACRFVCTEVLGDFPYSSKADKANTIALLLTPIIRQAITGLVPIAVIDAPRAGTGKGLLSDVVALIPTGRSAGMMSAPDDESEWRKQITSRLLDGATVVVIDNVDGRLASASLSRVVTARYWQDRLLGTNQQPPLPQRATWIVNGNNIQLGGDLPRRCYRIRLDSKEARPWLRSGWRHANLPDWVRQRRGELLAALLTMCRAWFVAGCPRAKTPILGSFEDWSVMAGGILAHIGVPEFLGNLTEMYEHADDGSAQWEGFLAALRGSIGSAEVTARFITTTVTGDRQLQELLPDELLLSFSRSIEAFVKQLGYSLRRQMDVRYGDLRLVRCSNDSHSKVAKWKIVTEA